MGLKQKVFLVMGPKFRSSWQHCNNYVKGQCLALFFPHSPSKNPPRLLSSPGGAS